MQSIWGSLSLLSEGLQGVFSEIKTLKSSREKNELNLLPKLPLQTAEEVISFNQELENNDAMKRQMVYVFLVVIKIDHTYVVHKHVENFAFIFLID